MDTLNVTDAMKFYERFFVDVFEEKQPYRDKYEFKTGALASPGDWELLAAILVRQRRAKGLYGHDLEFAEVKSAKAGAAFEYQYHKKTGQKKLDAESKIDHIFISYEHDLSRVLVRVVDGADLKHVFDSWLAPFKANYAAGKQRFRKTIPQADLPKGVLLLEIDGRSVKTSSAKLLSELFANSITPLPTSPAGAGSADRPELDRPEPDPTT